MFSARPVSEKYQYSEFMFDSAEILTHDMAYTTRSIPLRVTTLLTFRYSLVINILLLDANMNHNILISNTTHVGIPL